MQIKPMVNKIEIEFDPTNPVLMYSSMQVEQYFGEHYKYDLPKWCKQNKVRCFYYPPTKTYILMSDSVKDV